MALVEIATPQREQGRIGRARLGAGGNGVGPSPKIRTTAVSETFCRSCSQIQISHCIEGSEPSFLLDRLPPEFCVRADTYTGLVPGRFRSFIHSPQLMIRPCHTHFITPHSEAGFAPKSGRKKTGEASAKQRSVSTYRMQRLSRHCVNLSLGDHACFFQSFASQTCKRYAKHAGTGCGKQAFGMRRVECRLTFGKTSITIRKAVRSF